jgi:hypothetical protein
MKHKIETCSIKIVLWKIIKTKHKYDERNEKMRECFVGGDIQ